MLELHDLYGCQVLRRLRLWTCLVRGDEKKRRVHDRCAVKHRSHQDVVPGAIDERYVTDELHTVPTSRPLARRVVLLVGAIRAVVPWPWTGVVFAFVDLIRDVGRLRYSQRQGPTHLRVCIPKLNRDVSNEFVFESDSHDARYGFYDRRFTVRDMADGTCVREMCVNRFA